MPTTFNLRTTLWILLATALLWNYTTWMKEYVPPAPPPGSVASTTPSVPLDSVAPVVSSPANGNAPAAALSSSKTATTATLAAPSAEESASAAAAPTVHVVTDVFDAEVSLAGGELKQVNLLAYPAEKKTPNIPVRLLNDDSPTTQFLLEGGLATPAGQTAPTPTHLTIYHADTSELKLAPGQNELTLPLTWSDGHGVTVIKRLVFKRGEYRIDVDYSVQNQSDASWSFVPYTQIVRYNQPVERSYFRPDSYAYKGPAFFDGQKFAKLNLSKNPKLDQNVRNGWLAATQHDFVAAIVPPAGVDYHFLLQTQGNEFLLKAQGPVEQVAAGGNAETQQTLFVGPKVQSVLNGVHPKLGLVADYGYLRIFATPLFWLLDHVHSLIGNWGWTIIIVTMLIKLLFYPLAEASGKSMAKMKALGPRMTTLRETYKDDREKLNKATMELYQREKVNPLAGCLPMLIQIPVFLAFYWVLRDSVEMRQAPFMLWINDLSARDPFFVLPAIMAGAMFLQYKINPQVGDPAQQKIFAIMPLAMSATFAFFPAGLVLYYVTNTLLSILQQWNINRRIAASGRSRR
ncbi:MAG TPA: membrane protein insertase YidC [Steroidobacteraceae bacterium]|nr:membrane protein insertase YidC [Steroidobacteraceae bacterium]